MEYKCQTMSISQMVIGTEGFVSPICETCKTVDCTNPIERKQISIVGVTRKVKTYVKGIDPYFVVGCEGYTK